MAATGSIFVAGKALGVAAARVFERPRPSDEADILVVGRQGCGGDAEATLPFDHVAAG